MEVITAILSTWSSLITWFTDAINDVSALFYAEGNLTFIGGLCVLTLALSIAMLVVNKVKDFVQMRA